MGSAAARHGRRWAAAAACALAGLTVAPATASAHPVDELLQQVYVTPTTGGIEIDLELTPGVGVAPTFVEVVDTDGDGSLSAAETAAHAVLLHAAVTLQVDGVDVATTVQSATYPDADLLAQGGGTIVVELIADLSPTGGERSVIVTDSYAPLAADASPMVTTVQVNLTPSPEVPVDAGAIDHSADGRTLTASYSTPSSSSSAPATIAAESATAVGATWWTLAAGVAGASVVAATAIWRRRSTGLGR